MAVLKVQPLVLAIVPFAALRVASETTQRPDRRRVSRRHHVHHERTLVRTFQPYNRHCIPLRGTGSLVLLFIRENVNVGSIKVLEVTEHKAVFSEKDAAHTKELLNGVGQNS